MEGVEIAQECRNVAIVAVMVLALLARSVAELHRQLAHSSFHLKTRRQNAGENMRM
jgi:hypothetical protein